MAEAMTPTALWQQRRLEPWLRGCSPDFLAAAVAARSRQLQTLQQTQPRLRILLAETDPVKFLAGFLAACLTNCDIALGNPAWGQQEWQQARAKIRPHLCWGSLNIANLQAESDGFGEGCLQSQPSNQPSNQTAAILIPTGGTTGRVRFVVHRWQTLLAAVQGFCDRFGQPVNAYCVLPLYHVSGLMQALRTWISGGQLAIQPFRTLLAGQILVQAPQDWMISLVPTQLQRLLAQAPLSQWLSRFRAVLLGGAPAWPDLLTTARDRQIPLALTYGMTETASQVAVLMPDQFLQGQTGSGQSLPHAQLKVVGPTGGLPPDQVGSIAIRASSLAEGYYREPTSAFADQELCRCFYPDDLGYFDLAGSLHVTGRVSDKIITGGENVFPAEVEAALRATRQVADVCVIGLPDPQWGQIVTAIYVPLAASCPEGLSAEDLPAALQLALAGQLSRYKHPRQWIAVDSLPRNPQGKLNRRAVQLQIQHRAAASRAAQP